MSRMYDAVMRASPRQFEHPPYFNDQAALTLLEKAKHPELRQAHVFDVSNVSTYFYEVNDKEWWKLSDFHRLTPPFQYTWMEAPMPTRSFSKEHGMVEFPRLDARGKRWGIFLNREEVTTGSRSLVYEIDPFDRTQRIEVPLGSLGCRWQLHATLIIEMYDGTFILPAVAWTMWLDAQGAPITKVPGDNEPHNSASLRHDTRMSPATREIYIESGTRSHGFLNVALLALQFINCKNVRTVLHEPPPKLDKKHMRRYGKGLSEYHTIEITPMRGYQPGDRKKGDHAVPSIHIARGHFKTFTEERPLFGKRVGTYWWEEYVRGDPRSGLSEHDYSVVP